jgi:hypothetical protein
MRKSFTRLTLALCMLGGAAVVSYSQEQTAVKANEGKPIPASSSVAITATSTPIDLARAALAAQGGDKFKNLKNLVLGGSAELYAPNSATPLQGDFTMVQGSGDRFRLYVKTPIFQFLQIFDGQQTYSSIPNLSMPNPAKSGFGLLTKFEQTGYTVSALPDKKKQRAFRITGPEGDSTDFFVDAITARVVMYTIPVMGSTFIVEQKNLKEIDGVLVPYTIAQKFGTPQGDYFAEFKVKTAKLNETLGDDVFNIPTIN